MPELVVVGGGPAGMAAALAGARRGASVTLIERGNLGGTCVHAGCIPAGAYHRTAEALEGAKGFARVGLKGDPPAFDWAGMQAWATSVVGTAAARTRSALEFFGIEVLASAARFSAPGVLEGAGRKFEGSPILVCTGARSIIPDLPGDTSRLLTNDSAMALGSPPGRVVVVGAGRFSIEWADLFRAAGSQVTVVSSQERILVREDAEIAGFLQMAMEANGVRFVLGAGVEELAGNTVVAGGEKFEVDVVLSADTRVPNVEDLDLDTGEIAQADGAIAVDERCAASTAGVWAAGDVTGEPWLSNRAEAMGAAAAANALGESIKVRPERIPRSVNAHPEIAAVGLTEEEAIGRGIGAETLVGDLAANMRAVTLGEDAGAIKLVVDTEFGEILGAHMVGSGATEVIAQVVLAMEAELEYRDLARTHHIHPSLAELVTAAASGY